MRRALRSWKCRAGIHDGTHVDPTTLPIEVRKRYDLVDWVDQETGEVVHPLERVAGCEWRGCSCYCHPWFVKRTSLAFVVGRHVERKVVEGGRA